VPAQWFKKVTSFQFPSSRALQPVPLRFFALLWTHIPRQREESTVFCESSNLQPGIHGSSRVLICILHTLGWMVCHTCGRLCWLLCPWTCTRNWVLINYEIRTLLQGCVNKLFLFFEWRAIRLSPKSQKFFISNKCVSERWRKFCRWNIKKDESVFGTVWSIAHYAMMESWPFHEFISTINWKFHTKDFAGKICEMTIPFFIFCSKEMKWRRNRQGIKKIQQTGFETEGCIFSYSQKTNALFRPALGEIVVWRGRPKL